VVACWFRLNRVPFQNT